MLLGCIADDFTGATDLANTLVREGMASVVTIGVPRADFSVPAADAVVVALKSRSCPAPEAVAAALAALEWLRRAGARQFFFKYSSTFDSTDAGNIGPVAEALLDALGADFTVACPAFPANERTVYLGHLFVGETLLAESGMRRHPLNPMTDSNLVRVLQRQSRRKVGLVPFAEVERGVSAVRAAIERLRAAGVGLAIVDALTEAHLLTIGTACAGLKLLTGGSGLALGLPENFRRAGLLGARAAGALPQLRGASAVLAGSCSEATRRQVERMRVRWPSAALDPGALEEEGDRAVRRVLEWAGARLGAGPVLIYSTAEPDAVERTQAALGRERAGHLVESAMARIAQGLVASGVRRLVVAGGETSGAVVGALGIEALRIGPEIAPGVPWTASAGEPPLLLALKSGNFGGEDFFLDAFAMLETADRA